MAVAPIAAENLPAAQSRQVSTAVAPTAAENLPAVQFEQAEAPVEVMYVPAVHSEQVATDADGAPVCPYFPAEQSVPEQVEAPAAEYLPAKQLMQVLATVAPTVVEYLPAAQFVQLGAPACEYDPAGHSLQVSLRTTGWRMVP
jgi:hypothetical protein